MIPDDQAEWADFVTEPTPAAQDLTAALEADLEKMRRRAAVLREMALAEADEARLDALYFCAVGLDIDASRIEATVAARRAKAAS